MVARTGSWDGDLDTNVGAVLHVMEHCQTARAFLHCSTTGVYQPQADHVFREDDALGDNQSGTFTAAALVGKGTMTVESVRLAKDPAFPYVIGLQ